MVVPDDADRTGPDSIGRQIVSQKLLCMELVRTLSRGGDAWRSGLSGGHARALQLVHDVGDDAVTRPLRHGCHLADIWRAGSKFDDLLR